MENNYKQIFANLSKKLKENLPMIIMALVMIVYIFKKLLTLGKTDQTLDEVLADSILNITFGLYVGITLGNKGIMDAKKHPDYIETSKAYGKAIENVDGKTDTLRDFCDRENAESLKSVQKAFLRRYAINYDEWINNKLDITKLTKKQKRALSKVHKVKVFQINPDYLLSNCEIDYVKLKKMPSTITDYKLKRDKRSFFIKLFPAFIFGWYGFKLVENPSWSYVLSGAIQVGTWLAIGVSQYITDYSYMIDDFRTNVIIRKTNYLIKYKCEIEKELSNGNNK